MGPRQTERFKLTATFINGIAIAVFAVGAFTPIAAAISPVTATLSSETWILAGSCGFASLTLHVSAWAVLGGLPEDEEG